MFNTTLGPVSNQDSLGDQKEFNTDPDTLYFVTMNSSVRVFMDLWQNCANNNKLGLTHDTPLVNSAD